ncbi:MAG: hypothetical protein ACW99U_12900 [Candidatus Thorarchaeota archaeon]|jgi:hypothetical protein
MPPVEAEVTIIKGAGDEVRVKISGNGDTTVGGVIAELVNAGEIPAGSSLAIGGAPAAPDRPLSHRDRASVVTPAGDKG